MYSDKDEWDTWKQLRDPVLHIEVLFINHAIILKQIKQLRKWADLLIIAPLTANTLAKIANGLCDNLLTCIVRAWDYNKPLLVAPAMNTYMWDNPFTLKHLKELESLSVIVIPPVAKVLACGDNGLGALADVDTLVYSVLLSLKINI